MTMTERAWTNALKRARVRGLPEDIGLIVMAALDLAYYREVEPAGELARDMAEELVDRARRLPEVAG
jgi:hypothetical protein